LTAEYLNGFAAPYVKESQLKFGLRLVDHLPIKANGTVLIIGEVIDIHIKEEAMDEQGHIDLSVLKSIGVSGLNTYYTLKKVAHMPYARVQTLPEFKP
jgi:flavin reductase (DIM6/NTAB) family NADH-FMN oxidoreductase RutF